MPYQKWNIQSFAGGVNTAASPRMLAPGETLDLLGVKIRDRGRLEYQGGFNVVTSNSGAVGKAVRTFAKYIPSGTYGTDGYQLLMATRGGPYPGTPGSTALYSWSSLTKNVTSLAYTFDSTLPPLFATLYGKYFIFGKVYDGTTLRNIGPPQTPPTAPSVSTGGTGQLTATKVDPFGYAFTAIDQYGQESNPSPVFLTTGPYDSKQNTISINAGLNAALSSTVSYINIYRTGGGTDRLLLTNILGPLAYNNATGITYDDNRLSASLGTEAPYENVPPAGGGQSAIYHAHGDRLFIGRYGGDNIANTASRLGFSTRYQPEKFGNLVFDVDADAADVTAARNYLTAGGYFDIDTDYDNPILGLTSWGNLLVIFRKRSIHVLEGDNQANFRLSKHADIGLAGPLAHAKVFDTPFFMGNDGMIYKLTNFGVEPVGLAIERTLLALPKTAANLNGVIANAVCVFHKEEFIFAVPGASTTNGVIAYALDLRYPRDSDGTGHPAAGAWRSLTDPSFAFNFGYSDATGGDNADLILAPSDIGTGYDHPGAGTGMINGLVTAFTKSDRTPELVQILTGWFDMGAPSYDKRLRGLRFLGDRITLASGETAAYAILESDNDRAVQTAVYPAYTPSGGWMDRTVAGYLKGRRHRVRFSGIVSDLDLASIEVDYTLLGETERS